MHLEAVLAVVAFVGHHDPGEVSDGTDRIRVDRHITQRSGEAGGRRHTDASHRHLVARAGDDDPVDRGGPAGQGDMSGGGHRGGPPISRVGRDDGDRVDIGHTG